MEPTNWGHFSWPGLVMRFGSCTNVFVWGLVQGDQMPCTRQSWPRFAPMLSRISCLGLNSKACFTLRSLIWSDGVATVRGVVLGELMLLCTDGPQGLRQWLAGCF